MWVKTSVVLNIFHHLPRIFVQFLPVCLSKKQSLAANVVYGAVSAFNQLKMLEAT